MLGHSPSLVEPCRPVGPARVTFQDGLERVTDCLITVFLIHFFQVKQMHPFQGLLSFNEQGSLRAIVICS